MILLSIGCFVMVWLIGFVMFGVGAVVAILSLFFSIAAVVFLKRCLSPRPAGPPWVLIASIGLCAAYGYLFVFLFALTRMH